MKNKLIFTVIFFLAINFFTYPQEKRNFGFGAELGFISATITGSEFLLGFIGDYQVAENFSLAEIISFTPSGELFQMNANTVARFNIPLEYISLIPYMGLGFSYGSLEAGGLSENSFSLTFPIGAGLSYLVAEQIQATVRVQYAITNLDYGELGKDTNYFTLMFGFRFTP